MLHTMSWQKAYPWLSGDSGEWGIAKGARDRGAIGVFVILLVATIAQVSAYVKTCHTDVHTRTCVYYELVIPRETDGGGGQERKKTDYLKSHIGRNSSEDSRICRVFPLPRDIPGGAVGLSLRMRRQNRSCCHTTNNWQVLLSCPKAQRTRASVTPGCGGTSPPRH